MIARRRVLIDTGAIYAFVTRNDKHHAAAKDFVRRWLLRGGVFVLADVVFSETMTLLKARLGTNIAIQVGHELRTNPAYVWSALGPEGEHETWTTFAHHDDKQWSYTDCALLALARRVDVPQIFGFDHHFDQMPGVTRVPTPTRER